MTAAMGTSLWLAPEIILCRQDYDQFADIYSLGVVLSELDTHQLPYEDLVGPSGARLNAVTVVHAVGNGTLRPTFSDTCPRELEDLAHRCLDFDPARRPTANAVMHALSGIMAWHQSHRISC
ncbi:TPA: hypothetical protein N0F65_011363 [Lagenidium giganteum]|uniref:Protein kinase domain-containing protein n=1 Tax=Lagenidium giganteum TaxID=4803 RepID=A0AAV2Z7G0_9STRA|nr:TPA: hypothetical protein N0F65_011363 [Lagenidium giganteum]